MTESMIERVAKALCEQGGVVWGKLSQIQKAHHLSLARAAIEAMREPTDAMWLADGLVDHMHPTDAWEIMIDAALQWPAGSADRAGVPLAED